jgi:hypothetical protein
MPAESAWIVKYCGDLSVQDRFCDKPDCALKRRRGALSINLLNFDA